MVQGTLPLSHEILQNLPRCVLGVFFYFHHLSLILLQICRYCFGCLLPVIVLMRILEGFPHEISSVSAVSLVSLVPHCTALQLSLFFW